MQVQALELLLDQESLLIVAFLFLHLSTKALQVQDWKKPFAVPKLALISAEISEPSLLGFLLF